MDIFVMSLTGIVGCIAFLMLVNRPHYGLPFYYLGRYILRFLMQGERVRTQVFFQIALILFCMFAAFINRQLTSTRNGRKIRTIRISAFDNGLLIIGFVALVECINGFFAGYQMVQILIDLYKVIEMFLLYYFIRTIWRSEAEAKKSLDLVIAEMCVFGVLDVFTTSRGGMGINIAISFFPFLFARGFYEKKRWYWVQVILACVIVLTSMTRTYWGGFALGVLAVALLSYGYRRKEVLNKGIMLVLLAMVCIFVYVGLFNGKAFDVIFERFSQLFREGFAATGQYRVYETDLAIEKFLESPLLGKGYGYLETVYIQLMGTFEWGDFMHNAYAEVLAKTGIFGCLILGTALIRYIGILYRDIIRCRRNGNQVEAGYAIGGFAGTLSWLLIYSAAPLSSYGYVFIPGIVSLVLAELRKREL